VKPPRGLSVEEAAAWARVAATVKAFHPPPPGEGDQPQAGGGAHAALAKPIAKRNVSPPPPVPLHPAALRRGRPPRAGEDPGLDSHWDRRIRAGSIEPDFTLDLHGHTLDQAHARLESGLAQAKAMGARVVLVIAGKPRPVDAADRGAARGAIRAKLLDWLAAGPHGGDVAAIRKAHRRHGGDGALYLVLKRR